ncbi:MAG: selenocysteine-specific translation elongation factor [Aquificaceae bacterium]|nr:selenocysteine-specific translation elongation factor [Aquificaceae bacterium]MDW8423910.1 selenocysteine-specific translation elongation factor [Aquificaceae bacterium]
MKYFPLGVAGHVDHGKTTLVKALTHIDTDRLPEEKRRGMSIDMGFAFLDFPEGGLRVEIIDLPGHERFIKNAICGLSAVWGLLLVVDAGEGIMPQTVEHLRLAKSFGISQIIVALTKTDRVDDETINLAKEEIEWLLKEEGVDLFGIYPVSSLKGYGLEGLREGIGLYARGLIKNLDGNFFRFYVDSAFTVKGYGTVIRGSCVSGRLEEGDTVRIEPSGISCKVRRMQNHGVFVKVGYAGERLALNTPDIEPNSVERGYFLVKGIIPSKRLIVKIVGQMPKGLGYLFLGMREVSFFSRHIQEDLYLLRLSETVPAIRGDKGPLLDSSGNHVGSYCVLHPLPLRSSKRFIKSALNLLTEAPTEYLLIERGYLGLSIEELFSFYGGVVALPKVPRVGKRLYHPDVIKHVTLKLEELLSSKNGVMPVSEAFSKLRISEELLMFVIEEASHIKVLEGYLLDAKKASLEELEGYKRLMSLLSNGIKEEKELEPFKAYLALAVRKGHVYSLGDYLYISKAVFESYVNHLRSLGKEFTIGQAKELLGLTRKYLIPLLEHMDRLGITRREGERRVFLG